MPRKQGPLALIIIDGWGYSRTREGNAIALAAKPFYDELNEKYPRTLLTAHGARVGLPDGVMGNSEVGHLNMGAGRVIRMDVSRIDREIATGEFFSNEVLAKAMDDAKAQDPVKAIRESYQRGVTDEFVEPIVVTRNDDEPAATIQEGDAVIFFNFRPDRARQLTRALAIAGFDEFPVTNRPALDFVCFSVYDVTFPLPVAFRTPKHENILADVFARFSVENFRLAETEKYAHVTYFFNGGTEKEFRCEQRLLVPSLKIATYDLEPAMR